MSKGGMGNYSTAGRESSSEHMGAQETNHECVGILILLKRIGFSSWKDLGLCSTETPFFSSIALDHCSDGTERKGVKGYLVLGIGSDLKPSEGFTDALPVL